MVAEVARRSSSAVAPYIGSASSEGEIDQVEDLTAMASLPSPPCTESIEVSERISVDSSAAKVVCSVHWF